MRKHLPALIAPLLFLLLGDFEGVFGRFEECDEPEYFGICNPFVPGIILNRIDHGQPIAVAGVWPQGPAAKAGFCPGDKILRINNLSVFEASPTELLRELIAESPKSVTLLLERETRKMNLTVPRVRESELARLSHQKFLRRQLVPLDQRIQGLERVEQFIEVIGLRFGLKQAREGIWVPVEMSVATAEEFADSITQAKRSGRICKVIPVADSSSSFAAGFSLVLLADPKEALVLQVFPNSPARQAGLMPGDRVIELSGTIIEDVDERAVRSLMLGKKEPQIMHLLIARGNIELNLELRLEDPKDFMLEDLDPASGEPLSIDVLPDRSGGDVNSYVIGIRALYDAGIGAAIVKAIDYPSPAFSAGVQVGDQLERLNGLPVKSIDREKLNERLAPQSNQAIHIEVKRGNQSLSLEIRPERYQDILARIGFKLTGFGPAPSLCPD